mgnify:CR=1 FL=1
MTRTVHGTVTFRTWANAELALDPLEAALVALARDFSGLYLS